MNIQNHVQNKYKSDTMSYPSENIPGFKKNWCIRRGAFEPTPYQRFVAKWVSSPDGSGRLLAWHGLGSGKTCTAYMVLRQFANNSKINKVIVAAPNKQMLVNTWMDEMESCVPINEVSNWKVSSDSRDIIKPKYGLKLMPPHQAIESKNPDIFFLTYSRLFNGLTGLGVGVNWFKGDKGTYPELKKKHPDPLENSVLIIDEAHYLGKKHGVGKELFDTLIHAPDSCKIVLLTATPVQGELSEIAPLLYVLQRTRKQSSGSRSVIHRSIPLKNPHFASHSAFDSKYGKLKDNSDFSSLQKSAQGLISFLSVDNDPRYFAPKDSKSNIVLCEMPVIQRVLYIRGMKNGLGELALKKKANIPTDYVDHRMKILLGAPPTQKCPDGYRQWSEKFYKLYENLWANRQHKNMVYTEFKGYGSQCLSHTLVNHHDYMMLKVSSKLKEGTHQYEYTYSIIDKFTFVSTKEIKENKHEQLSRMYTKLGKALERPDALYQEKLIKRIQRAIAIVTGGASAADTGFDEYDDEDDKYRRKSASKSVRNAQQIKLDKYFDELKQKTGPELRKELKKVTDKIKKLDTMYSQQSKEALEDIDSYLTQSSRKYIFAMLQSGDNKKGVQMISGSKGIFNQPANKHGRYINTLLLQGSDYKEGLSLQDVSNVHLLEPPSTIGDKQQIIGRAIRRCSHKHFWKTKAGFPPVKVYEYISVPPNFTMDNLLGIKKWGDQKNSYSASKKKRRPKSPPKKPKTPTPKKPKTPTPLSQLGRGGRRRKQVQRFAAEQNMSFAKANEAGQAIINDKNCVGPKFKIMETEAHQDEFDFDNGDINSLPIDVFIWQRQQESVGGIKDIVLQKFKEVSVDRKLFGDYLDYQRKNVTQNYYNKVASAGLVLNAKMEVKAKAKANKAASKARKLSELRRGKEAAKANKAAAKARKLSQNRRDKEAAKANKLAIKARKLSQNRRDKEAAKANKLAIKARKLSALHRAKANKAAAKARKLSQNRRDKEAAKANKAAAKARKLSAKKVKIISKEEAIRRFSGNQGRKNSPNLPPGYTLNNQCKACMMVGKGRRPPHTCGKVFTKPVKPVVGASKRGRPKMYVNLANTPIATNQEPWVPYYQAAYNRVLKRVQKKGNGKPLLKDVIVEYQKVKEVKKLVGNANTVPLWMFPPKAANYITKYPSLVKVK